RARRQASMRDLRRELDAIVRAPAPDGTYSSAPPPPVSQSRPANTSRENDNQPEWLERNVVLADVNLSGRLLAAEPAVRPGAWLASFVAATEESAFDVLANRLEAALPELVSKCDLKTLFAVRRALDHLAVESGRDLGWRVARARELQRPFGDPALLSTI